MKVYLVFGVIEHEGSDVLHVFDSHEKAEAFVKSCTDYDKMVDDLYEKAKEQRLPFSRFSYTDEHPAEYFHSDYEIEEHEVK